MAHHFKHIAILLLVCGTGCLRRDGRNSDCMWPAENGAHLASPRHLSADAEFAEDLAIRFADTHHGLRTPYFVSGEDYDAARDGCMATLFGRIAVEHGVPVGQVSQALGRNRDRIDVATNLPFALLYCLVAAAAARIIWRRYSPTQEGWIPGAIMALFLSLTFAAGGMMLGESWSWFVENRRTGNGHISYRARRLPWARHRAALFGGELAVFWTVAGASAYRVRPTSPARRGSSSPALRG